MSLKIVAWEVTFSLKGATYTELSWRKPSDIKLERMKSEGKTDIVSRSLIYGNELGAKK